MGGPPATAEPPGCIACEGGAPIPEAGDGGFQGGGAVWPGVDPAHPVQTTANDSADCPDCEWSVVTACPSSAPGAESLLCLSASISCPERGDLEYRVYFRDPPGAWQDLGTVCLGPGEAPVPVTDIAAAVRDEFRNLPPENQPQFYPRDAALVNLPTIFAAGSPASRTWNNLDVLGFDIRVEATATFEWRFDAGVTETFDEPGGAYPDKSVTYTYTTPGRRAVTLTTRWRGQFFINGDGPYDIEGTVDRQSGPLDVPVLEATSGLVSGRS
jgi:hypothetical protein